MLKTKTRGIIVKRVLLPLLACLFFVGCSTRYSEAPRATNFPNTTQDKMQAGAHWQAIANHLADSVVLQVGTKKSMFINAPAEKSDFTNAFHSLFLSSLVSKGATVAKVQAAAEATVDIKSQIVKFTKDRALVRGMVGVPTALTAGAWAMSGFGAANTTWGTVGLGTGLGAVGLDLYNYFGSKYSSIPEHVIIVTVNVSDASKYLGSISNVYYIADSDSSLYAYNKVLNQKRISVLGGNE